MNDKEFRQHLLQGKKSERIIFAVTPEFKEAVETIAKDRCVSASALITELVIQGLLPDKDIL